jgi:hypothetical protein
MRLADIKKAGSVRTAHNDCVRAYAYLNFQIQQEGTTKQLNYEPSLLRARKVACISITTVIRYLQVATVVNKAPRITVDIKIDANIRVSRISSRYRRYFRKGVTLKYILQLQSGSV